MTFEAVCSAHGARPLLACAGAAVRAGGVIQCPRCPALGPVLCCKPGLACTGGPPIRGRAGTPFALQIRGHGPCTMQGRHRSPPLATLHPPTQPDALRQRWPGGLLAGAGAAVRPVAGAGRGKAGTVLTWCGCWWPWPALCGDPVPTVPSPSPVLLQAGACLNRWPADKGGGQEHPSRCKSEGTAPAPSKADTEAHHWTRYTHQPSPMPCASHGRAGCLLAGAGAAVRGGGKGTGPAPAPAPARIRRRCAVLIWCGCWWPRPARCGDPVPTAANLRPDGNGLEFKSSLTRCPLLL